MSADAQEAWQIMGELVLSNERRKEVSEAVGLSFVRLKVLRRIAHESRAMGELAAMMSVDPPYMTVIIDALEQQGLVERQPHPQDRRAKLLVATSQGKKLARKAESIMAEPPAELAGLAPKDLAELVRILRAVKV